MKQFPYFESILIQNEQQELIYYYISQLTNEQVRLLLEALDTPDFTTDLYEN
jgi:hypothetical protein